MKKNKKPLYKLSKFNAKIWELGSEKCNEKKKMFCFLFYFCY